MTEKLRISIPDERIGVLRSLGMNWSAAVAKPYDFDPTTFTTKIEGLKPKSFTKKTQHEMLANFMLNPKQDCTYGISSLPNDGMSKLLAAWMMNFHMKHVKDGRPLWHDLQGGFDSKLLDEHSNCTLMVLNNIGTDSSGTKKEKFRDIMEKYADIPKIVVCHGADPFTFITQHFRLPVHGIAYLTTNMVKKAIEL